MMSSFRLRLGLADRVRDFMIHGPALHTWNGQLMALGGWRSVGSFVRIWKPREVEKRATIAIRIDNLAMLLIILSKYIMEDLK